jgi:hypothetical protein
MIRIAILDDYQNASLEMADWSPLAGRAVITVFNDHLSNFDEIVERLLPFDVVCVMRERTPLVGPTGLSDANRPCYTHRSLPEGAPHNFSPGEFYQQQRRSDHERLHCTDRTHAVCWGERHSVRLSALGQAGRAATGLQPGRTYCMTGEL